MGTGVGAGMGMGMGFMMPQMIQQSMMSSMQGNGGEKETPMDKLKKLKELLDMGVINEEEFNQKKSKLMDQI
jgi:membrane protease subunit (stomatin/prohibitin family)